MPFVTWKPHEFPYSQPIQVVFQFNRSVQRSWASSIIYWFMALGCRWDAYPNPNPRHISTRSDWWNWICDHSQDELPDTILECTRVELWRPRLHSSRMTDGWMDWFVCLNRDLCIFSNAATWTCTRGLCKKSSRLINRDQSAIRVMSTGGRRRSSRMKKERKKNLSTNRKKRQKKRKDADGVQEQEAGKQVTLSSSRFSFVFAGWSCRVVQFASSSLLACHKRCRGMSWRASPSQ